MPHDFFYQDVILPPRFDVVILNLTVLTKSMVVPTPVTIAVSSYDTIAEVKKNVATKLTTKQKNQKRIFFANLILRFGNEILDDTKRICECNLTPTPEISSI